MSSQKRAILQTVCVFSMMAGLAGLATPSGAGAAPPEEANVFLEYFAGKFGCNGTDLSKEAPFATARVPKMHIMRAAEAAQTIYGIHNGSSGAARFTGWVEIEKPGTYSFQVNTGSSSGAALSVNGDQLVAASCGEIAMGPLAMGPAATADLGAGYHQVIATFMDDGQQDQLALSYLGPDTDEALEVIPAYRFRVANVRMEYFTGNMDCRVPDLSGRIANQVQQIPNVNIPRTSENNGVIFGIRTGTNWAARFTGLLHVARGGLYTFKVAKYAADSAALTIDGHQLFSAGCSQREPKGSMSLAAGFHNLVLIFADDGWQDQLVLSYHGPDTGSNLQVVPASKFSDAEWTLGAEGQDCNRVCRAVNKKCNERALGIVRTAADISRVANLASYSCRSTTGWAYSSNPGICTNPKCCLDGSCTGWCAWGHHKASSCGAPAAGGHYSRLCPCH